MITVGIHLVWTAYGTWLPGDDRGHWSPLYDAYGRILERGGQFQMPSETTWAFAYRRMNEPSMVLSPDDVQIVADEIGKLTTPTDAPHVYAATVEPTHAHLLIGPVREELSAFVGRLKGRTSSAVLASGRYPDRKRVWTEKYWKAYIGDNTGMDVVREYIERHHLRAGRSVNPYRWCRP